MRIRSLPLFVWIILLIIALAEFPQFAAADVNPIKAIELQLGNSTASVLSSTKNDPAISSISIDGAEVLTAGAYFTLESVATGKKVKLASTFTFNNGVYAQIALPSGLPAKVYLYYKADPAGFVAISATVKSSSSGDQGWKLAFHLPMQDLSWVWQPGLTGKMPFTSTAADPLEASQYPITALVNDTIGFSLAVPVTSPSISSFYRAQNELVLEFPLGTSPLQKPNANTSIVQFQLWRINPQWGMRQALNDYYKRFPTYYQRIYPKVGLWSVATPEKLQIQQGFLFHEVSFKQNIASSLANQIVIDNSYGWKVLPYIIPGQMTRSGLSVLPPADADIDNFLAGQVVSYPPQLLGQYLDLSLGSTDFSSALAVSRTLNNLLTPNYQARDIYILGRDPVTHEIVQTWDNGTGKSVTFPVNPSPALTLNGMQGQGARLLQWVDKTLSLNPNIGGFYIDSIPAWGKYANYRREHFYTAAFLPLTCDTNGGVYLPNNWGQYDFLYKLKARLQTRGGKQIILGNGDWSGSSSNFFLASLLDIVGAEKLITDVTPEAYAQRYVAGPKATLRVTATIGNLSSENVRRFINTNLAMGFLPSTWGSYFSLPEWLNSDEFMATSMGGYPNYERDKANWQRVFATLASFGQAKWEPVTLARPNQDGVLVERFTALQFNYFTVYSSLIKQNVELRFDANTFKNPHVIEVFSGKAVPAIKDGESFYVSVPLPQQACALVILRVNEL